MSAKGFVAAVRSMSTLASRNMTSGVGLVPFVISAMIATGASAEQSQQAPTSDHQQLCKDLYNIYDTNMDEYYNKKNSAKVRQSYYLQAKRALSDFRKQGCKTKDIK